jgi:hypothetical protein
MKAQFKSILQFKLETIRDFQKKYPESHVGGSFGLFLLGYDLKRDFNDSDLDLITPSFDKNDHTNNGKNDDIQETSESNDFNYNYRRYFGCYYVKYDISINTEQTFQVIQYEGNSYNVSLFENIMKYKREYAAKGVFKHTADIAAIETGVRPIKPNNCGFGEDVNTVDCEDLDLPF